MQVNLGFIGFLLLSFISFPTWAAEDIEMVPENVVLWEVSYESEDKDTHQIYRDVVVTPDNHFMFVGQVRGPEGNDTPDAYWAVYDQDGRKVTDYQLEKQGYQSFYDVISLSKALIVMGDYSEYKDADKGASLWGMTQDTKDKIHYNVYEEGVLTAEGFIEEKGLGLYAPRMLKISDDLIVFKVLARNKNMQETTRIYTLGKDYKAEFVTSFKGRALDITLFGDDVLLSGSDQNGGFVRRYDLKTLKSFTLERADGISNVSAVGLYGRLLAVEMFKEDGRFAGTVLSEGDNKQSYFYESYHMSAKDITPMPDSESAIFYLVEPTDVAETRYSLVAFYDEKGRLCKTYRIGAPGDDNIIISSGVYSSERLILSGARAIEMDSSSSALQKTRYFTYTPYGMAIDLNGLKTCS